MNPLAQRLRLFGFCALLAVACVALAAIAVPPRVPAVPSQDAAAQLLAGSSLPLEGAAVLLTDLAWIFWAWLVLSLVLELAVAVLSPRSSLGRLTASCC